MEASANCDVRSGLVPEAISIASIYPPMWADVMLRQVMRVTRMTNLAALPLLLRQR